MVYALSNRKSLGVLLFALLTLLIVLSRTPYFGQLELDPHEVWTMWQSIGTPPLDYSIGLHVLDTETGALITQSDSGTQLISLDPMDATKLPAETSQWKLNQLYVEERTLNLPDTLPFSREGAHTFELALVVYQSGDNTRVTAPGLTPDGHRILRTFTVRSW